MADRRARIIVVVFGVFVFLGISFLLARALTGPGAERSLVLEIVRAQARGDAAAVLERLPRCRRDATCSRLVRERTPRLERPGHVEILNYQPSVQLALTNQAGIARVAWRADGPRKFPVVQCVQVRREGPLTGGGVELVSISGPIGLEAGC